MVISAYRHNLFLSPIPPNSEIPFLFMTSKENAEDVSAFSVSIDGGTIRRGDI